jgi:uncharacterized protein YdhG (YjbR/CyaY superfamily)
MLRMKKIIFKNTDEYLLSQPEPVRTKLEILRLIIRNAVPEAEEVISYQMPAFRFHGMLVFYAAFKNHFSLFVSPEVMDFFREKLDQYSLTKSAIHFPKDALIPEKLILEIVKYAASRNLSKKVKNSSLKKNK